MIEALNVLGIVLGYAGAIIGAAVITWVLVTSLKRDSADDPGID